MLALNGYYDGTAIQALEKINAKKNQKLIITVLDEFIEEIPKKNSTSARGSLAKYANTALWEKGKYRNGKKQWVRNMVMLDANVILRYLLNDNEEIVGKYVNTESGFYGQALYYDKVNFSSLAWDILCGLSGKCEEGAIVLLFLRYVYLYIIRN